LVRQCPQLGIVIVIVSNLGGFILCYSILLRLLTVTVGTQAAVLAGLDITMFIEFNPPHNDDWVSERKMNLLD
jgi:hypothetical protein